MHCGNLTILALNNAYNAVDYDIFLGISRSLDICPISIDRCIMLVLRQQVSFIFKTIFLPWLNTSGGEFPREMLYLLFFSVNIIYLSQINFFPLITYMDIILILQF